jgi:hypothetical protein
MTPCWFKTTRTAASKQPLRNLIKLGSGAFLIPFQHAEWQVSGSAQTAGYDLDRAQSRLKLGTFLIVI